MYIADSINVALGIGNWAIRSYCLVVTRANCCIVWYAQMPKCPIPNRQFPMPKATLMESGIKNVCVELNADRLTFVFQWGTCLASYRRAYQRSALLNASIMFSIKGAFRLSCFSRIVNTSSSWESHSGWLMSRTWTTKSWKQRQYRYHVLWTKCVLFVYCCSFTRSDE